MTTKETNEECGDEQSRVLETIAQKAMKHLSDPSDDVKSAAAQILIQMMASDHPEQPRQMFGFLWKASQPLWRALQNARTVSSSIVDLVTLFAELAGKDASEFLCRITSKPDDEGGSRSNNDDDSASTPDVSDVVRLLLRLLDSDFSSVRMSALRTVGIFASASSFVGGGPANKSSNKADSGTFALIVERVFELFFARLPAEQVSTTSSRIAEVDERDQILFWDVLRATWERLSDISCDVLLQRNERDSLEFRLLFRYFGIGHEILASSSEEPMHQIEASRAIALFLCSLQRTSGVSDLLQYTLTAVHSPHTTQCEAACLLYRALKVHLSDSSSLQDFEAALDPEMELLCLRVANIADSTMGAMCDQAFVNLAKAVVERTKSPAEASSSLARVWVESMQSSGASPERLNSEQSANTIVSMRVRATVAGAVLAKGLPAKITPLIRALVTLFNNELRSASRREQTCEYLTELLVAIRDKPQSEKAQSKIFGTLCDAATLDDDGGKADLLRKESAVTVLRAVVKKLPSSPRALKDVGPLWARLAPLTLSQSREGSGDGDDDDALLQAASLLEVVSSGLAEGGVTSAALIDAFVPTLVNVACDHTNSDVRSGLASGIIALCQVSPGFCLQRAVPLLVPKLREKSQIVCRMSACQLLKSLVETAGTEVCPFVRSLLPLVLSLVTDHEHGCAQTANSIFALLVRIAPLVRHRSSAEVEVDMLDEHGESVIDHLIFGEPLPACTFPDEVTECLRAGKVSLRQYQMEGVSWLRFLRTVNLNGALCDDMGLGKVRSRSCACLSAIGILKIAP